MNKRLLKYHPVTSPPVKEKNATYLVALTPNFAFKSFSPKMIGEFRFFLTSLMPGSILVAFKMWIMGRGHQYITTGLKIHIPRKQVRNILHLYTQIILKDTYLN